MFLDATYCKARVDHRVVSQAVLVAAGVAADGHREVLAFDVGESEDGAFLAARSAVRSSRADAVARAASALDPRVDPTVPAIATLSGGTIRHASPRTDTSTPGSLMHTSRVVLAGPSPWFAVVHRRGDPPHHHQLPAFARDLRDVLGVLTADRGYGVRSPARRRLRRGARST